MNKWVMSANPNVFNHEKAFQEKGYIDWKQTRKFSVGDIIYVYVTKPISKIQFKAKVVSVYMAEEEIDDYSKYWVKEKPKDLHDVKYARLILLDEFKDDRFDYSTLKEHGLVYPPQSPCRVNDILQAYIEKAEDDQDGKKTN